MLNKTKVTIAQVRKHCAQLGISYSRKSDTNEHCVDNSYYTDDGQDAMNTASHIASLRKPVVAAPAKLAPVPVVSAPAFAPVVVYFPAEISTVDAHKHSNSRFNAHLRFVQQDPATDRNTLHVFI